MLMNGLRNLVFIAGTSAAVACVNAGNENSAVRVTNPDTRGLADEYPEVVAIELSDNAGNWSCSATFIGPEMLLTAAHCMFNPLTHKRAEKFTYTAADGKKHIGQGFPWREFDPKKPIAETVFHDLALGIFPSAVAPKVATLNPERKLALKEKIILVGFGASDLDDLSGAGQKRAGTNVVDRQTDNVFGISGTKSARPGVTPGTKSAMGPGDSGGGIFDENGLLVGVISAGESGKEVPAAGASVISHGVDIMHPNSLPFFDVTTDEAQRSMQTSPSGT